MSDKEPNQVIDWESMDVHTHSARMQAIEDERRRKSAARPSTVSKSSSDQIVEWWSRLSSDERKIRFTVEEVLNGTLTLVTDTKDAYSLDTLRDSLKGHGFKRKLFEDGWFYVVPAKFFSFRVLPVPNPGVSAEKAEILPPEKNIYTYFIQSVNGGPIKIGKTDHLKRRLAEMQTANPFRLRYLLVLPEGTVTEKEMHGAFEEHRIDGGEWFHPENEILDFIEEHLVRFVESQ